MKSLPIRARMIEDDDERDLVIVDGVIADAYPVPGIEPDALGWVLPGRPQRGGHLWSHVWALTAAIPLARHAGDPRAPAWHNEALTTAQRSGMRSLARDLLQLA
jgi:hypothetical protein